MKSVPPPFPKLPQYMSRPQYKHFPLLACYSTAFLKTPSLRGPPRASDVLDVPRTFTAALRIPITSSSKMEIDSCIKENTRIIEVDPSSHMSLGAKDIRVDRSCRSAIIRSEEVALAL